ncbi:MAG: serine hydrolase, partial [Gemmatimonadota bacterium]
PARTAAQTAADPLRGLDDYVREAIAIWEVPGLAIAVVKDGEIAFERGYGVVELGSTEPVTPDTRFAIGSTTKAITAAALGLLVDEGKVAWSDPVTAHLPAFRLADPYVNREATVRDLLTHRAGLGNADFLWYEQENSSEEILRRLRFVEPAYSLRAGFIYQNIMYLAAGAVLEAASGSPWDAFVRERILRPLGMDGTVPHLSELRGESGVATPHDVVDGSLVVIENSSVDAVAPAGSIWSSAHDMALWLDFLLSGGFTPDGTRLLAAETLEELFTPQVVLRPDDFYPTVRLTRPHWLTYGFGWFQHDYRGRKLDFHTGSIDGMVAIVGLVREEGIGVVVLANRDHTELRHALLYRVLDLYLADEPRDWSAELEALYDGLAAEAETRRAEFEERRVEGTSPTLSLDAYTGTYRDPLYGEAVVVRAGDGLRVRYGRRAGLLEHWHYDTFRVRWDTAWRGGGLATFRLDAAGRVGEVEIGGIELERVEPDSAESGG